MFIIKARVGLKNKELTQVNDCFQTKCNAENGHYGQTLYSKLPITREFSQDVKTT